MSTSQSMLHQSNPVPPVLQPGDKTPSYNPQPQVPGKYSLFIFYGFFLCIE